jgi:hypothetical protein
VRPPVARTMPLTELLALAAMEEAEAMPPSTRCDSSHFAFARPRSWPSLASKQARGGEGGRAVSIAERSPSTDCDRPRLPAPAGGPGDDAAAEVGRLVPHVADGRPRRPRQHLA